MDEDSRFHRMLKWALGGVGLSATASAFLLPLRYGVVVAGCITILFLLFFGGYFLWQRRRARRQREQFASAIEAQTAATPKAISDPTQRANLDLVRQKFQQGFQKFKEHGKDIYKLPWFVIIGEPASGKTEAIRHSSIDFPPGVMGQELPGSGGTINMDWWFTNDSIILDTAGSMLFNEARPGEAPEWREFLRLLKRARPACPINGLFLVLSVDSLIKDSADTIAQKASRLAQQLDLIQRTLDVRFPVYLVVTKSDLLTGFREFFDVNDPDFQYQMFGWSNPDPLDAHFRPDLVEQHLRNVADRLRRRRLALIRDTSGTGRLGDTQQFFASTYQLGQGPAPATRRLDEVDSLFALPESVMRLAPRLRRYLETIFVAGEWSAKPVFLRGIYFTSSMREGQALDEAIAQATGLPLDQLPGDRSLWEKNRAFFLRDLFKEKVFRESGLVTRASNTLKLLRQRKLAIFGSAGTALLLLLVFAGFAHLNLKRSVLAETSYWKAGADILKKGDWSPAIVSRNAQGKGYVYGGTNIVPGDKPLTLVEYNQQLSDRVTNDLRVGWVFKPMKWLGFGNIGARPEAQRLIFEASVLDPLVQETRVQIKQTGPSPSPEPLGRHKEALLSLIQFEADGLDPKLKRIAGAPAKHLGNFLSYLVETNLPLGPSVEKVFVQTYPKEAVDKKRVKWPPESLVADKHFSNNLASIVVGLENYHQSNLVAQTGVDADLKQLKALVDGLDAYRKAELAWLANPSADAPCESLTNSLLSPKAKADSAWRAVETEAKVVKGPLTNLASRYSVLVNQATEDTQKFSRQINLILGGLQQAPSKASEAFCSAISSKLNELDARAAKRLSSVYDLRPDIVSGLDKDCVALPNDSGAPVYQLRWSLYTTGCDLTPPVNPLESMIGDRWQQFSKPRKEIDEFRSKVTRYREPLSNQVSIACSRLADAALQKLRRQYAAAYQAALRSKLTELEKASYSDITQITNARGWFEKMAGDLLATNDLDDQATKLKQELPSLQARSRQTVLENIERDLRRSLGFPILLSATNILDGAAVVRADKLLGQVSSELTNPTWAGLGALDSLKASLESWDRVARALLAEDKGSGSIGTVKVYFVPDRVENGTSRRFINVYRWAQLSCGSVEPDKKKLTDFDPDKLILLGECKLDSGIKVEFSADRGNPLSREEKDWAFVRLIRSPDATRAGNKWRVPLKFNETDVAVLELEPVSTMMNWPK